MKKLILVCFVLLSGVAVQAQIEKGDIQLGGSVSYTSNETGGLDNSTFTFTPQAGLFVSETTSVGVLMNVFSNTFPAFDQTNGNTVEQTVNNFSFGAYARFHKPVVDNFYLFLQPSILLGSGKVEQINANDADISIFNIGVAPGLTYFLSPKFALEMNVGGISYGKITTDNNGVETESDGFNLNLSLASVGLGLNFYIR